MSVVKLTQRSHVRLHQEHKNNSESYEKSCSIEIGVVDFVLFCFVLFVELSLHLFALSLSLV